MSTRTILQPYADDEDDSVACTFHTPCASRFDSIDDHKGDQEDEVTSSNVVNSFVKSFTRKVNYRFTYGEEDGALRLQQHLLGQMLRQVHEGDNGKTYLAELMHKGAPTLYAVKVIRKDHCRKLMERNVLKSLHHPFLPNVYANVESLEFAFLVMDFCPGGDLRALLQRRNSLSEKSAKFYATEALLAMEYLHGHGIIYRGLKPENVLIKANGHIMLSGFDYTMCRTVAFGDGSESESEEAGSGRSDHVVLAPEVIKGKRYGTAADWYTFGIFLYELLFRTTPFKVRDDDRMNCMDVFAKQGRRRRRRRLTFPQEPVVSPAARDLLERLLNKNPKRRLGHKGGAAEVKQHAFFQGVDFALLQKMADGCMRPPELPTN